MTLDQARQAYEASVFGGDPTGLPAAARGLDAIEAQLCLERGKLIHAAFLNERGDEDPAELALFERARELWAALGDPRGEGEATFWAGCFHQVVRDDDATARPLFERARELSQSAGDRLMLSYTLRHLGFSEHLAGRLDAARAYFEESSALRRALGFDAGVAANLVGLAYIAAEQGRPGDAAATLDEAGELAAAVGAHGIARLIAQARLELAQDPSTSNS
ncbi:tetratricopeptide repeat protein [Dactylosporangium salmoneum]|uniref:Tetratricopeptide repeat protein n=1 Tax=Dactylosporangium salmoneum TaxID=53361 RepID=A0ABN3HUS6_9ACTN